MKGTLAIIIDDNDISREKAIEEYVKKNYGYIEISPFQFPARLRQTARSLALIVNAGHNMVIGTCNDWVIREISALVCLSSLPEIRESEGYPEDHVLDPVQVKVVFKGVNMAVDTSGIGPISVIDDEIRKTNMLAQKIAFGDYEAVGQ